MGIPDHLTSLLRNLYAGQEATEKTRHGIMDWFQIGKGVCQSCILSPCLFNVYTEYIMQNARLDEAQNQDCWEKYQSPQICRWHHPKGRKWRGTKEPFDEGERGQKNLKLNIQKTKIMASGPITSWQIDHFLESLSPLYQVGLVKPTGRPVAARAGLRGCGCGHSTQVAGLISKVMEGFLEEGTAVVSQQLYTGLQESL